MKSSTKYSKRKEANTRSLKNQPAPHEDPLLKINTDRPANKEAPILEPNSQFGKTI